MNTGIARKATAVILTLAMIMTMGNLYYRNRIRRQFVGAEDRKDQV